jgi:hypothetical protein
MHPLVPQNISRLVLILAFSSSSSSSIHHTTTIKMKLHLSLTTAVMLSGFAGVEAFSNLGVSRRLGGAQDSISGRGGNPPIHSLQVGSPPRPRNFELSTTSMSLNALSSVAAGIKSLHGNTSYVLTAILWLSTFGVSLERRTTVGKALSAPLATMALALTVANLGLIPFDSPICKKVQG